MKKWGLAAAVAREKRKAPVPQKYWEFLTQGHVHETDMESETRFRADAESCRVIGHEQKNGRAPLLNLAGHFLLNGSISPGIVSHQYTSIIYTFHQLGPTRVNRLLTGLEA